MLNLYDYLTPLDNERIDNYIREWGVEEGYVGNDVYLQDWNKCKKKLFHLFGGKLIVKKSLTYEKPKRQLENDIYRLTRKDSYLIDEIAKRFRDIERIEEKDFSDFYYEFSRVEAYLNDKIDVALKYKSENKKGTLQLQVGMKPIRAIQKIIQYFGWEDLKEEFENFRLKHSMIFNEKIVKGELCLSIHPLDFITMSDNNSDWSSCMSWTEGGCYHVGTVEMMNSNNVICAYIESKSPFHFSRRKNKDIHSGDEWHWNNKKWRQLFYVTKDIIVGGKSYPYENNEFTKAILEMLRELAKENLNWTYSFGPELYKDMKHVNSLNRMNRNRMWVRNKTSFKHNILFDTKGMYNDMLNDNNRNYWCIRNKVKREKIISYSGKAPCLCCMLPVLEETNDYDYGYNERYENTRNVICISCADERRCNYCDNDSNYYSVREVNGENYCKECWDYYIRQCPRCKKPFHVDTRYRDTKIVFRHSSDTLYLQDISNNINISYGYACDCCIKEMVAEGFIEKTRVEVDEKRHYYSWDRLRMCYLSKTVYDKDSEFIQPYKAENLLKIPTENTSIDF